MLTTFLLVVIGWIIFRAETIHQAWDYLSCIVVDFHPNTLYSRYGEKALIFILIVLIVEWLQREKQFGLQLEAKGIFRFRAVRWGTYYVLFIFTILFAGRQEEFIYFQF
jgi:hypothetical protein